MHEVTGGEVEETTTTTGTMTAGVVVNTDDATVWSHDHTTAYGIATTTTTAQGDIATRDDTTTSSHEHYDRLWSY